MTQSGTRVALVADTHGFLDPRVAEIARASEIVIHAGDVGTQAILDALACTGAHLVAVRGNNDDPHHWPQDEHALIERLPTEATVDLPGGLLAVEHGHRFPARTRHRRLREAHRGARAVVCGHSHRQVIDRDHTPWILNPGAAGRSRAYGGPGCLLLLAAPGRWRVEMHRFEPLRRHR